MISFLFILSCSSPQPIPLVPQQELTVAATFYPLYDLTKSIVGDKGTVYSIVPAGVEPHEYEPNPSDLQKLSDADVFVTMGIEFAEFEKELGEVHPTAEIIAASTGISLLKAEDEHATNDPHIWLSPKNAQKMALNIMTGIAEADPQQKEYYLRQGQQLIDDLNALDMEFKESLASCTKEVILVNHNSFSYLARDYGFKTIAISGLEPEAEPTPQQLAELVTEAKKHSIKYVFYEDLIDPRVAKTIAEEVGAETLKLDPLEGSADPSATYTSLMRKNLLALQLALECS